MEPLIVGDDDEWQRLTEPLQKWLDSIPDIYRNESGPPFLIQSSGVWSETVYASFKRGDKIFDFEIDVRYMGAVDEDKW